MRPSIKRRIVGHAYQHRMAGYCTSKLAAGRMLFSKTAIPACAVCHSLKDAGAEGAIGPSLDELKPYATRVEKAVRNGIGQMPAFKNLTDEQIKTLSE